MTRESSPRKPLRKQEGNKSDRLMIWLTDSTLPDPLPAVRAQEEEPGIFAKRVRNDTTNQHPEKKKNVDNLRSEPGPSMASILTL